MAKRIAEWTPRPGKNEFEGAMRYLSLQCTPALAERMVAKARQATPVQHVAKDVLRASLLPLLPTDERHVAENLKKIGKGKSLAPIIAIRGDLTTGRPLVIGDGYHRMCAACHADEDSPVAVVLVDP